VVLLFASWTFSGMSLQSCHLLRQETHPIVHLNAVVSPLGLSNCPGLWQLLVFIPDHADTKEFFSSSAWCTNKQYAKTSAQPRWTNWACWKLQSSNRALKFKVRIVMPNLTNLSFLALVVQRADNSNHRINHYAADSVLCFVNIYLLDSDSSGG